MTRQSQEQGPWWGAGKGIGSRLPAPPLVHIEHLMMGMHPEEGFETAAEIEGGSRGTVRGYPRVGDLVKPHGPRRKLYLYCFGLRNGPETVRVDVGVAGYASGAQTEGGFKVLKIEVSEPDERVCATTKTPQAGLPFTKGNDPLDADTATLRQDAANEAILEQHQSDACAAQVCKRPPSSDG